jgi:hypothetical protein
MAVDSKNMLKLSQNPDFYVNLNFVTIKTHFNFLKKCLKDSFSKNLKDTKQGGLK